MKKLQQQLRALADSTYQDFQCKLMPTVDPDTVLGVRIPVLRRLSKELYGTPAAEAFLLDLPHVYYEENNLHAFLIAQIPDFEQCIVALNAFLPFVNNWATCDSMRPKCFANHKQELLSHIRKWMDSSHSYTVRFGIEMLMLHYLDEDFDASYLSAVSMIRSEDYYILMMCAWFFATALTKQWEASLPFFTEHRLSAQVHQKAIQKAIESRCITKEKKEYLKTLREK